MTITTLLERPDLWRAGRPGGGDASHRPVEPSRYPLLDQHLTGGGWPVGAVSELCFNQTGIGELRLLAPALASLSRQQRWIAWVNPPFLPYPPALAASGIRVGRMLLIRQPGPGSCPEKKIPERQNQGERLQGERLQGERLQGERLQGESLWKESLWKESPWKENPGKESYPQKRQNDPRLKAHQRMLWALEQASRSGACSAVLAWLDERLVTVRDLQRLQVAARQGNTLTWLFRPGTALQQPSLASLRLQLHAAQSPGAGLQRLRIDIVKRQGGWPVEGLVLDLQDDPGRIDRRQVTELLTFWRSEQQRPSFPTDPKLPFSIPAAVQQRALH